LISIRGMKPHELDTVHRMLERAFRRTSKAFFDQQVRHDPLLRPQHTRLLVENGRILSCVRVYFRKIGCKGMSLSVGGIGDVGTDPSAQGKGYATQLLTDTTAYMRKKGAILSILFTRIQPFYRNIGYLTIPTLDIRTRPPAPSSSIAHRPVDMNRDLSPVIQLYKSFNQHRTGPVIRRRPYWKHQLRFPRLDPKLFWVCEEKGKITCYMRGFINGEILRIQEFGCLPGREASLRNLIATMARILNKKNVHMSYLSYEEVNIFTPWYHEISENTTLMARLLQFDKLAIFDELLRPHRFLFWEADRF
jgi:predicted acetyltransferase